MDLSKIMKASMEYVRRKDDILMNHVVNTGKGGADFFEYNGEVDNIVTNPPYGERMGSEKGVEELYRTMGEHFRSLAPWQVYIITSHPFFE